MVCVCVQMAGRVFGFEPFKRSKSINFFCFLSPPPPSNQFSFTFYICLLVLLLFFQKE